MKKRTLNALYLSALAVSITGGVIYGVALPKHSGLKEMTFSEFEQLLIDKETARANIEHIQIFPDRNYYCVVTLKSATPKERVIRTFPDYGTDDALNQASQYGIRTTIDQGQSGAGALLNKVLGLEN